MLNIIKLCVGISTVEQLEAHRESRDMSVFGFGTGVHVHRTRSMPRRASEIVGLGSLYWVIAGSVRCRQSIIGLEQATGEDGRTYCDIVMSPLIVRTRARRKRPFQGWRYLEAKNAPADLVKGQETAEGDASLAQELADLGLI